MPKKKIKSAIPRKYRKEEPVWRSKAPKKNTSRLYNYDKRYYFNLKARRWKRHIDGDWDNGPIISRVPLFPEQAVLSCCTSTELAIRLNWSAPGGFSYCRWYNKPAGAGNCNIRKDSKGNFCGEAWGTGDTPSSQAS